MPEPKAWKHDDAGGGGEARRRCLRCDKWFTSQGRGNRICPKCAKANSYLDAEVAIRRACIFHRPTGRDKAACS